MKHKIGYFLLYIASTLKQLGKKFLPKTVVTDVLSVSGWFIVQNNLVHYKMIPLPTIDFTIETYKMPEDWNKQLANTGK